MFDLGLTPERFADDHFEKSLYFKASAFDPSRLGWNLVDQALPHVDPSEHILKLFKGERIANDEFTEEYMDIGFRRRRIVKENLYSQLRDGATLVINRFDIPSRQVADLCLEISKFTGSHAIANAYASFGGDGAFGKHWDTHDVMVMQLSGSKLWSIYRPTHELPIASQMSKQHKPECPISPCFERVLQAGDMLYVPRGWWHCATPIAGCDTLHLAIGLHTPLMLDYLLWICAAKLPEHLPFRRSMQGHERDAAQIEEAASLLHSLMQNPKTFAEFRHRTVQRDRVLTDFNIDLLVKNHHRPLSDNATIRIASRYTGDGERSKVINGRRRNLSDSESCVLAALQSECRAIRLQDLHRRLVDIERSHLSELVRSLATQDLIELREPGHSKHSH